MTERKYPTVPSNISFDLRSCSTSDKQFTGTFEENLRKIENLRFPEADKWTTALALDTVRSHDGSRDIPQLPVLVTAATPTVF